MIIERSLVSFISLLFIMLNTSAVRSLSDDSENLLEIVHRQDKALKTLMEGMHKLTNTVEEMRAKIRGQETTINDLLLRTASQTIEIEALRKTVSGIQENNNSRSTPNGQHTVKFPHKEDHHAKKKSIMGKFDFMTKKYVIFLNCIRRSD
jgi:predicted RNase H-like nuclease (RuvC/YqgF family)